LIIGKELDDFKEEELISQRECRQMNLFEAE